MTHSETQASFLLKNGNASRETIARLTLYEELLRKWQRQINLVSPSTLPDLWTRHFSDSAQLQLLLPKCRIWVDMGSGAGFPGLVTAVLLAESSDHYLVHLIESDQRKCAFLRTVSREMGLVVQVHNCRIEDVQDEVWSTAEAVSARALAPLADLILFSEKALDNGAKGVFLKGSNVAEELTLDPIFSKYHIAFKPSVTDPRSSVVLVER